MLFINDIPKTAQAGSISAYELLRTFGDYGYVHMCLCLCVCTDHLRVLCVLFDASFTQHGNQLRQL
jgi:hypothetical protein